MPQVANPPENMPRVTVSLTCDDVAAATIWLCEVFGFTERTAARVEHQGTLYHSEMEVGGDGLVMLGPPFSDRRSPRERGGTTSMINVYVDDVDAHHAAALAAGARIHAEPEDTFYGARAYRVADSEGHHWMFSQQIRDIPPEEWDWEPGKP